MTSKFRGIIDQAKGREPEPADADATPDPPPGLPIGNTPSNPSPAPAEAPVHRGPGRPKGKRSNPGFVQATAYLPAELHHGVKLALLQERKGREFSELVGELLAGWLASRPSG